MTDTKQTAQQAPDKDVPVADVALEIVWDAAIRQDWTTYFSKIQKPNIIQTYAYAKAMRDIRQQVTRFGVIYVGGNVCGLVQMQEVRLLGLVHFVFLDRGPLWLEDVGDNVIAAFFTKFNKDFPKRFGRKRRIIPELPHEPKYLAMMQKAGFVENRPGYHSIWLDLQKDEDEMRKSLKPSWRNQLVTAEKVDMQAVEDTMLADLPWLVQSYMKDRLEKKYAGPSPKLIEKLCHYAVQNGEKPLLLKMVKDHKDIAGILIFIHGASATYQIGWTGKSGRKSYAHNLLLWQAALQLKARGVHYFDLGGINVDTAEGVARFKRGMGGQDYSLLGTFV